MNCTKKNNFQFTEICSTNMARLRFNAVLHRLSSFHKRHSHAAVSWSFLSVFLHCASPLMTPSSPDTKPWPLQGRCGPYTPNSGPSGWNSLSGPRPIPGRRHMTWETWWSPRHEYRKVANCFHTRVCFSNWATPPPTGKKTLRFWPLSFWTLKNQNFSQKHVQIIFNHVFKMRLEAFINIYSISTKFL